MVRTRIGRIVVVGALIAALGAPGVGHAQGAGSPVSLPDGQWVGDFGATGQLTGSEEGITILWNGTFNGEVRFEVDGSSAAGRWDWFARVRMDFVGGEFPVDADLTSTGSGPLAGSGSRLQMTGEETTVGSGGGMGMTTPIGPNTSPIVPIDVVFVDVTCNQAIADWTTSLIEGAADAEFTGTLDGWFVASYLGEAIESDLPERIDELFERAYEFEDRLLAGGDLAPTDLIEGIELVNEALALEVEARGTEDCVFADDPEFFATWFTGFLAAMVAHLLPLDDWTGEFLEAVIDLLLYAGAIGAGADPRFADVLQPLLRDELSGALGEIVIDDGTIWNDGEPCTPQRVCIEEVDEFLAIVRAADKLGLNFELDGTTYSPTELLEIVA